MLKLPCFPFKVKMLTRFLTSSHTQSPRTRLRISFFAFSWLYNKHVTGKPWETTQKKRLKSDLGLTTVLQILFAFQPFPTPKMTPQLVVREITQKNAYQISGKCSYLPQLSVQGTAEAKVAPGWCGYVRWVCLGFLWAGCRPRGGGLGEYQAGQTHSRVSNLDNFQLFLHFVSVWRTNLMENLP